MISLVLLAGGTGARMGGGIPKQFRLLRGRPLALYSFRFFLTIPEIEEIVVVCEPCYQEIFASEDKRVLFALPGNRRQDSVYHGLLASSESAALVAVHDGARPFVDAEAFASCVQRAKEGGAAALAVPAGNTIKQVCGDSVQRTLLRSELWEMQTPQIIRRELFLRAYDYVHAHRIEVTDDLSLVEALGEPTFVVKSSSKNFKVTTPFDWDVAEALCESK